MPLYNALLNQSRENLLGITELGEYVVDEYHEIEKKFSDDLLKDIPAEKVDVFFEVIDEISKRADFVQKPAGMKSMINNSVSYFYLYIQLLK